MASENNNDMRWAFFGLALGFFLAGTILAGPHTHQKEHGNTDPAKEEQKSKSPEPFWQRASDDPTAFFTLWLALFTAGLTVSTVGLWWATKKAAERQVRDTEILQRAYISVEPGGIIPATGLPPRCLANIEIRNVGNLPARKVRWSIQYTLDLNHRRPRRQLQISIDQEGDNTLPPGTRMNQGGRELIYVGLAETELKKQIGLYLYVWGVVHYEDGFMNDRSTYFCHRYNCVNLRNVEKSVVGISYGRRVKIASKYGRFHREGNEAT